MTAPMTAHPPESAVMDLPRRDARDKLAGRTRYTVDRMGPGMLHAAILRAEGAAGRIVTLDLAPALAMPGVRGVVSAADAPGLHGIGVADHPLFARDHVRHPGEALAAVAADTPEQARAALAAIRVEIDPDPAALTLDDALAPGARLVHPDWRGYATLVEGGNRRDNIAWEARVERGEVDAAFARPDLRVIESVYEVGRQSHVPFEPRAAVARWEDGRVHLECSTQAPWTVRRVTAEVMGLAPSQVRVTVPPVGGGFGLKFDCSVEPIAAVLARKTGRAVALELSRTEEAATCLSRENARIRIRSAVDASGAIVARDAEVWMDCGAYGGEQVFLTTMTAHTLGGNYRLGAVRLVTRAVYTNTPPNGAFRACNGVYCTFALERHTDEICAALGLDPIAYRRANVLGDGDLGATGQVFRGDVLGAMLDRMEGASAPILAALSGRLPDGRLYGRARTVGTWFVFVGPSSATVHLHDDGSATLVTAGVEIGSGSMAQGLPQIVAAQLGLSPDQVVVRPADTDASGLDMGVGGGRTTVSLGAASLEACAAVRAQLLDAASEMLQTPVEGLVLRQGRAEIAASPGAGVPIPELVARLQAARGPVAGHGAFTAPGEPAMPGCAAGHFIEAIDMPVHAVHEAEVAVDPDTGHVEVLAYRVVQDVGLALNPRAVRGQIQGGVAQGLGYALHEETTLDATGAIRQTGFESYRIPGALDVPAVETILHEGGPSIGPLGIKGAGEVPILNVPAAVACAVANAGGRAVSSLPLTPPRVLALLRGRDPEG